MSQWPGAVFLDRDGTINVKAPEGEYITTPDQLELLPGAASGIRLLNTAAIPVVVITNQRGVALGLMTEVDVDEIHHRLDCLLGAAGARIDEYYVCPHNHGACRCRKPGPELLERAARNLGLRSAADAVMVGDSVTDMEAGKAAGAATVLLDDSGRASTSSPDVKLHTLTAAVRWILARDGAGAQSASPEGR